MSGMLAALAPFAQRQAFAGLLLALVCAPAAWAQGTKEWEQCVDAGAATSPEEQIGACTAAIDGGKGTSKERSTAYMKRAVAYGRAGKCAYSMADFAKAIKLSPGEALLYYERANCWLKLNDNSPAIADFTKVIELDPAYFGVYAGRGRANLANGKLDDAIADFDKVIELNPKDASAYNLRGASYKEQGNIAAALLDYTRAARLEPKNADHYYGRGYAYNANGATDAAITDFRRAMDLDDEVAAAAPADGTPTDVKPDAASSQRPALAGHRCENGEALPRLFGCRALYCDPKVADDGLKSRLQEIDKMLHYGLLAVADFDVATRAYAQRCKIYLRADVAAEGTDQSVVDALIDTFNLGNEAEWRMQQIEDEHRFRRVAVKVLLTHQNEACFHNINNAVLSILDKTAFNGIAERLADTKCSRPAQSEAVPETSE